MSMTPPGSALLDQMEGPVAAFTGDGAYDQGSVYRAVLNRDPETEITVPLRSTAVPSEAAETAPTQRAAISSALPSKAGGVAEGVRLQQAQPG